MFVSKLPIFGASKKNKRLISLLLPLLLFISVLSPLLTQEKVFAAAGPLTNFGTWADVTGTTTITFDAANAIDTADKILLTFPAGVTMGAGNTSTVTCNGGGVAVTSTTKDSQTVTITMGASCTATGSVVVTSTAFVSGDATTSALYSVAIYTDTAGGTNNEWGVALKTGDNTTTVTAQVLDTVTLTVDTTTIALGVITPSTAPDATKDQTYTLGSNVTDGLALKLSRTSDGLYSGTYSWTNASGSACAAGTECYGIFLDAASNFTISGSYDTAHQAIPASATEVATTTGPVLSATVDVNYAATASNITPAGFYTDTITATVTTTP